MLANLRFAVMVLALALFGSSLLVLIACKFWDVTKREYAKLVPSTTPLAWKVLVLCAVCAFWQYGATKQGGVTWGTITFPYVDVEWRYLYDSGSSLDTNSVHLAFYYLIAPSEADLYVARRPAGSSDPAEWELVYTNTLGGVTLPLELEYEGAYTNDWAVYTTWTPGPAVHTNGVWQINWRTTYDQSILIPIQTKVYLDDDLVMPATGGTQNNE